MGLDLDGVLCDLGPGVATRIAERFGVTTHPATWRSYDLRGLRLGLPHDRFCAFLEETFADPDLYAAAPVTGGAVEGLAHLRAAGWEVVGITARPAHLASVTTRWLADHGLVLDAVHHTVVGRKAAVARRLGAEVAVEDNPAEAELLGDVCRSYLLDHPYNRDVAVRRAFRLSSWDDLVGRLCQLRLFAQSDVLPHFALTAVGEDRPGIVAAVTGVLLDLGVNLEDTSMTILRGQFAMVLVIDAPASVTAEALARALEPVRADLDLVVAVRTLADQTIPEVTSRDAARYSASVYGADRPGIVHGVARLLASEGVNIVDLSTRVIGEPDRPVYAMFLELSVPPTVDPVELGRRLQGVAAELGVDASIHPSDADIL